MDGRCQEGEVLHVFETYTIGKCGFCREWFCAQAYYVKVGVGALHRGIGKTKQNANKEVVYSSRENCGVVDRREIDGKKMERKPRLKIINISWLKRNTCKERSIGKVSSQTFAESGEGFGRHEMRRER